MEQRLVNHCSDVVGRIDLVYVEGLNVIHAYVDKEIAKAKRTLFCNTLGASDDFRSSWIDEVDLLSFCSVYDVANVVIEPFRLTFSFIGSLDIGDLISDLTYLFRVTEPNSVINFSDESVCGYELIQTA